MVRKHVQVAATKYEYDSHGNLIKCGAWDWVGEEWITWTENHYEYVSSTESWRLKTTEDASGRQSNYVYDATSQITYSGIGAATTEYEYVSVR